MGSKRFAFDFGGLKVVWCLFDGAGSEMDYEYEIGIFSGICKLKNGVLNLLCADSELHFYIYKYSHIHMTKYI